MGRGSGKTYRHSVDLDNLISVSSKKLVLDPNHRKALLIRASSLLKKGLHEKAIADCDRLIHIDPSDAGPFYIRGCCYEKLNELE